MKFTGLSEPQSHALRNGGPDAFGNVPEQAVSSGDGNPCRQCLCDIPKGAPFLIFAHKPFETTQPYSEVGPIFMCADACPAPDGALPEVLKTSPTYLLKAYSADERILYGTGAITAATDLADYAASLLARADVAFVDARSAKNNCWLARITRD